MTLPITRNGPLRPLPTKRVVVTSFNDGQITEKENDKIPFTSSSLIENMILWKDNLETRPGSITLCEDKGIVNIAKGNTTSKAKLITFSIDGGVGEINIVDRGSGAITSYAAPNITKDVDWVNGSNEFYYCYGTGVDIFNLDTGATASLIGATPKFITYAENRLWSAGDDGLKYSTIGAAAHNGNNFNSDMGTYDATTGVYPWGVSHGGKAQTGDMLAYTALISVGKKVVVFSRNQLQVHELPDAEFATFIDEKRSTLKFESSHGVVSKTSVRVVGEYVYFVNNDGAFVLDVGRKRVTPLKKNITHHQEFNRIMLQ